LRTTAPRGMCLIFLTTFAFLILPSRVPVHFFGSH
jgi:hypothetical protein